MTKNFVQFAHGVLVEVENFAKHVVHEALPSFNAPVEPLPDEKPAETDTSTATDVAPVAPTPEAATQEAAPVAPTPEDAPKTK